MHKWLLREAHIRINMLSTCKNKTNKLGGIILCLFAFALSNQPQEDTQFPKDIGSHAENQEGKFYFQFDRNGGR